ncbi:MULTISPECIES: MFS transporter [Xanthobacteraceae]|uniref:MFS family arabinose efflux permease n=1 Tax=Labrys monachus TaxID=217067 RepID=A0ABU0FG47_9HYPH|nr:MULTISPECIES: MFS transporter [Xanthobacteraceae]MBS7538207.1 MFS transporter [Ancylobacter lacus]MDQ0393501.1 putative MFS family arabinose efflux permease [Labrys monachus]
MNSLDGTNSSAPEAADATSAVMPPHQIAVFCAATGIIVANLYYAQPLAGMMAADVGLPSSAAGLIVTLTQIGFGLGLVFLVPLVDLVRARLLLPMVVIGAGLALAAMALAQAAWQILLGALLIGLCSTATQMLVPIAARLSPPTLRGRVVGRVMAGLLSGILASRPIAGIIADSLGWRAVFVVAGIMMALLAGTLLSALPKRRVVTDSTSYRELIGSMGRLFRSNRVVRTRAYLHAPLFAAFTLFWTAVPLHLGNDLALTPTQIGWFTLASAAGALAAPIVGRLADAGWSGPATLAAMGMVATAFGLAAVGRGSIPLLLLAATLLDFGVQSNLVLGQRAIFVASGEASGRANAVFMSLFFVGGAVGSAMSGGLMTLGGWGAVAAAGLGAAVFATVMAIMDTRPRARP